MSMSSGVRSLSFVVLVGACVPQQVQLDPNLQGRWVAVFHSTTAKGTNGVECTDGTGAFEIKGTRLSGVARNEYNQVYDVIGEASGPGSVKGEFNYRTVSLGTFEGQLVDGALQGSFADTELCRGIWTATRAEN